jgi:hypothetical protein
MQPLCLISGSTAVDSKMGELDMWLKQWTVILFSCCKWQVDFHSWAFAQVWWSYCGCQYYSVMDNTWQSAEWLHLQCSDTSHHQWADKLIHRNCHITTDELYFILFIDKGSVMAITKEPDCSKVYSFGAIKVERRTQRQGEQQPLILALIWRWCLRLPVADCRVGQNLGPTLWT